MGKTVYSIVLSEDVVEAIDSLAIQQGCSRSALINQVLAEYSGLSTPESQKRTLADIVRQKAAGGSLRADISTGGCLTLHTALRFKYNPSMRYLLDFLVEEGSFCRLRVNLRSRSEELLTYLQLFFELWSHLEQKHLAVPPGASHVSIDTRRYWRELRRPAGPVEENALGEAVAAYLTGFDKCIQTYFSNLQNADAAAQETEKAYKRALQGHPLFPQL